MQYTVETADFHTAISTKYPAVDILTVKPLTDWKSTVITDLGCFECESSEDSNGVVSMTVTRCVETQLVLVDAIQQYRMRYVIEVPVGKKDWALDTVVMDEAEEFSQHDLGETIVSHRVVTREEVLTLCDVDNEWCNTWTTEAKFATFVTPIKEEDVENDKED